MYQSICFEKTGFKRMFFGGSFCTSRPLSDLCRGLKDLGPLLGGHHEIAGLGDVSVTWRTAGDLFFVWLPF